MELLPLERDMAKSNFRNISCWSVVLWWWFGRPSSWQQEENCKYFYLKDSQQLLLLIYLFGCCISWWWNWRSRFIELKNIRDGLTELLNAFLRVSLMIRWDCLVFKLSLSRGFFILFFKNLYILLRSDFGNICESLQPLFTATWISHDLEWSKIHVTGKNNS